MTEVAFRHHTGRSAMDFNITADPTASPAGMVNSFTLQSGNFQDTVKFQNGTVNGDPNGLSIEALLEVCMIRLESLNQGKHENTCNHVAITKIAGAIDALKERTLERAERGVLGTEQA